jgi:hypothetical protein
VPSDDALGNVRILDAIARAVRTPHTPVS